MLSSFIMLSYAVLVLPFDCKIENFLLIFNEIVIITAIGHMIVFSDSFSSVSTQVKINAGWTFDFLILIQIIVNLSLYLWDFAYMVVRIIR